MNPTFTKQDVGCYIDGALGLRHAVEVMVGILSNHRFDGSKELLEDTVSQFVDTDDWLDNATTILQAHTEGDLVWYWSAGDLLLIHGSELD